MSEVQNNSVAPINVRLGILTQAEFDELSPTTHALIEASARELQARYGTDWLVKERDRLRDELSIID
jgi:hypothetical protein